MRLGARFDAGGATLRVDIDVRLWFDTPMRVTLLFCARAMAQLCCHVDYFAAADTPYAMTLRLLPRLRPPILRRFTPYAAIRHC